MWEELIGTIGSPGLGLQVVSAVIRGSSRVPLVAGPSRGQPSSVLFEPEQLTLRHPTPPLSLNMSCACLTA